MPIIPRVDRLWPDPVADVPLAEAFGEVEQPGGRQAERPWVAVNMVTSIDGRAQLAGTADGLGSRTDRRLMQLARTGFDAVASGAGTLVADDFYSRLADDLAAQRAAAGRSAQPLAVVVAGRRAIPTERRWFAYGDQPRVAVVGSESPHAARPLPGVETWVAPTALPDVDWLLQRLRAAGIASLLLEGGPTLNAAFLAAGAFDELFWTIGPQVLASDALPMVAALPDGAASRAGRLVSVLRNGDELFLRYRFGSIVP